MYYKRRKPVFSEVFNCSNCETNQPNSLIVFDDGYYVVCTKCVKDGSTRSKGTAWREIEEARLARRKAS